MNDIEICSSFHHHYLRIDNKVRRDNEYLGISFNWIVFPPSFLPLHSPLLSMALLVNPGHHCHFSSTLSATPVEFPPSTNGQSFQYQWSISLLLPLSPPSHYFLLIILSSQWNNPCMGWRWGSERPTHSQHCRSLSLSSLSQVIITETHNCHVSFPSIIITVPSSPSS